MLGPRSDCESTAQQKNFQSFSELALGQRTWYTKEIGTKLLFFFPKTDRETVKMSWHFVLFCVINCSFHNSWPWGVSNSAAWLQLWVWPTPSEATWKPTVSGRVGLKLYIWTAHLPKFTTTTHPQQVESFSRAKAFRWRFYSSSACGYLETSDVLRDWHQHLALVNFWMVPWTHPFQSEETLHLSR